MTNRRPDEDELIHSAMIGDIEKIKLLLSTDHQLRRRPTLLNISGNMVPLDINTTDKIGRTALHWIASRGHEYCVDIIMQHLETKSLVHNKDGRTPLHEAAMNGHTNIVEKFLTCGIDHKNIDKVDYHGRTALHWATLRGHNIISKLLIEKGANVTLFSNDGQSALDLATNANYVMIMRLLYPAWAAQKSDERMIRGFFDHDKTRADPKYEDKRTLLSYASESGHDNIVKFLIEKGADIEAKDNYGLTPLSWAAGNGHRETVELLVEKGADIEAKDKKDGRTPLSWAVLRRTREIVKLLVEKGADIEARDNQG